MKVQFRLSLLTAFTAMAILLTGGSCSDSEGGVVLPPPTPGGGTEEPGGGGNTVKVRHNSVYTTSYMHLSKYAAGLKVGDRVHQGQVIGYVGATGTATGPHLDFRVWKNGTPINPLTMESPSGDPIKDEFRPALDSLCQLRAHVLDSLLAL